jgi:phosphopantothenoylcysteine synthetase/decarboxylase
MPALYVISCASPAAAGVDGLIDAGRRAGWTVCSILTPQATKFADRALLEALTGFPVRSEYKRPEDPDVLPGADAVVVYPATFNTVNKWALGISDTLALGLLAEHTGLGTPIVAVPCVRAGGGLDTHPSFGQSLERLRAWGVRVVYDPERWPPRNEVPSAVVLDALGPPPV